MVDVAARSRVAKATLYNHFRTKDDLLVAYVEHRLTGLARTATATASSSGLGAALNQVAEVLAGDPALRRAAAQEPELLAQLARPSASRGWELARSGVADVLVAGRVEVSPGAVELVLRWLTSQLLWPGDQSAAAEVLVAALGGSRLREPAAETVVVAPSAPVGWPSG
jgi:AcrR family transcriptional regulator